MSVRTITGMLYLGLLFGKFANFKTTQNSIKSQFKTMIYKNFFSPYDHIQLLDKTNFPSTIKPPGLHKPNQMSYFFISKTISDIFIKFFKSLTHFFN